MNLLGTKTLETERLILRKYKLSDAQDMYNNWGSDPKCNMFLPWETHKDVEETKEIIISWIRAYDKDKFKWIIELKDKNIAIGGIDVVKLKKKENICEVGYCIGSKYWNNGYTTEALNRVLEYLFDECDLFLVEARHHATNIASGKVMEKAGMIKECELRSRVCIKNTSKLDDLVVYSITKDEYKQKALSN